MKVRADTFFTLFLLAVVLMFIVIALGYPIRAAFGPLAAGIIAAILLIIHVVMDMKANQAGKPEKIKIATDEPPLRDYVNALAWIVGLLLTTYLLGILVIFPLFTLLYIKVHGWSWVLSIGLAAGVFGLLYGLFGVILQVPFYEGILLK